MAELPEGTVFAGHRIDGIAGRGGMGVVYTATHLALDHVVALKVITPDLADDPRFRDRFVRESRMAVSIRHPNVVQVRHAGEEDGVLFVTMDYVEGSDLRALISAERRIEPGRAARIIGQVAAALDAAHERGLVHRDVKPGNVLIEGRGSGEHVYLTDFGLTKPMTGATELTASGAFIGTLEYMAPEQIRGGELDARTDVYALGGVAFATITGEPPFGRVDGDVAKLYAHLNDPPPRASERAPGLPPAIDLVLQRAMAKDPDERYASAGEFARALERVVGDGAPESTVATPVVLPEEPTEEVAQPEPTTVETPIATREVRTPAGRRRPLGVLAGLAVVGAVVGLVALAGGGGDGGGGETTDGNSGGGSGGGGSTVEEISAGAFPVGVNLDGNRVLVASRDDGTVFAFNTETGEKTAEGTVEGAGFDFAVAGLGAVWAVDMNNDLLVELRDNDLEPTGRTFATGDFPRDAVVAPPYVWVTNRNDDTLTRVEPESGTVDTIDVGSSAVDDFPRTMALDGDRLWVSLRDSGFIQAIDAADGTPVTDPIRLGGEPHGLLVGDEFLWIANTEADSVQRLPLANLGASPEVFAEEVCDEPRDVAVGFDSVWVPCGTGERIVRLALETGRKLDEFPIGSKAETAVVSRDPDHVWVGGGEGGKLIEITPPG